MSDVMGLFVGVLLLIGNAFFVGAEFAVIASRRSQIEPLAAQGRWAAKRALHALEHVSEMLACAQLGITICSLGLGAIAEPALAHLIEPPFEALGLPGALLHPVAFAIALTIVVYLHIVIGEMVPKNLALAVPDRAVLILAPPLILMATILRPVVVSLNWVANAALRLFGIEPKDEVESTFTVDQIGTIVDESHKAGLIAEDPAELLAGALEFPDKTARDLMVTKGQVITLPPQATPAMLEQQVSETGFSRFPVVDESGIYAGYLHLKDVLYADASLRDRAIPTHKVRRLIAVAAGDEAEEALAQMQRSGVHLAVVEDKLGGALGVLFLEDVIEELVGEINDSTSKESRDVSIS